MTQPLSAFCRGRISAARRNRQVLVCHAGVALAVVLISPHPLRAQSEVAGVRRMESIADGEVRLDGRVIVVTGPGEWLLEATSFTSPRGVTKPIEPARNKAVLATDRTWVHPKGDPVARLRSTDVKLGARIAVIGVDQGSGKAVLAREIVLGTTATVVLPGSSSTTGAPAGAAPAGATPAARPAGGAAGGTAGGQPAPGASAPISSSPVSLSALMSQARNARSVGQYQRALALYEQALPLAQRTRDGGAVSLVLRDMAMAYAEDGQDQKSQDTFARAFTAAQEDRDQRAQASSLLGLGTALARMSRNDEALTNLERASRLAPEADVNLRIQIGTAQIAVLATMNRPQDMAEALRKLVPLEELVGDNSNAAEHALEMARLSLLKADGAGDAAEYLARALKRLPGLRDDGFKARLWARVGYLYWRLNQPENARRAWETGVKLAEKIKETKLVLQIKGVWRLHESVNAVAAPGQTPAPTVAGTGESQPAPLAADGAKTVPVSDQPAALAPLAAPPTVQPEGAGSEPAPGPKPERRKPVLLPGPNM